jgi:hypothetical protein
MKFKLTIPKPCSANWNTMLPAEKGRHCSTCNTEVVDFSSWNAEEIKHFIENSPKKICGRLDPAAFTANPFPVTASSRFAFLTFLGLSSIFSVAAAKDMKNHYAGSMGSQHISLQTDTLPPQTARPVIKGIIMNTSNKPLINVNIFIHGTLMARTNEKGEFEFKVDSIHTSSIGLGISQAGFLPVDMIVILNMPLIDLGTMTLNESPIIMGEVIVEPFNKKSQPEIKLQR